MPELDFSNEDKLNSYSSIWNESAVLGNPINYLLSKQIDPADLLDVFETLSNLMRVVRSRWLITRFFAFQTVRN
jgi:hypothetical protein